MHILDLQRLELLKDLTRRITVEEWKASISPNPSHANRLEQLIAKRKALGSNLHHKGIKSRVIPWPKLKQFRP